MVDLLKGIRVLSFNHFLMGPVGVQFLADLGADVIAVEPPGGAFQRKWSGANNKRVDGQSMGAPHRARHFRRILEKISRLPDVAFWTGEQIHDWYLGERPDALKSGG